MNFYHFQEQFLQIFALDCCNLRVYASSDLQALVRTGILIHQAYSTDCSQHGTDFAKTNQNEVMRIRTNSFKYFRIRKLICENEFATVNL